LAEKGQIKARNFWSSENKLSSAYSLTQRWNTEKTQLTGTFLKPKMAEYEALKAEIDVLGKGC
jgi:hypothetical protein